MTSSAILSLDPYVARERDHIRVFLRDCSVELSVGYHPSERLKPQPVVIGIEVEAALPHHYQDLSENSLDRVIDYERLYSYIREDLPRLGHIALLETVAEQIIGFCFEDRRIQKVRIKLEKPAMFAGSAHAGIEVCRMRPSSQSSMSQS